MKRVRVNCQTNFNFLLNNHKEKTGLLLEGGSRSGKTVDICQFIIWYAINNTGKTITVGRDTLVTLKSTLLIDFKKALIWWCRPEKVKYDCTLEINGNLIRFVGVNDDIMKAHGLTQDVFWLNEAMNISKDTIDQLEQRTSDFFMLDYNPSAKQHHIYNMEKRPDCKIHKTTVLNNKFAPKKARAKILSYNPWNNEDLHLKEDERRPNEENTKNKTADVFKWKVYGLGERAVQEGLVYPEWSTYEDEPEGFDWVNVGLDFGFTNDPTACVQIKKVENNLYFKQLIYETGLVNQDIKDRLEGKISKDAYLVCDSAQPQSIAELVMLDLTAIRCTKGAGSILSGINTVKGHNLFVHKDSKDIINELEAYKYKKDNSTGIMLNNPQDKDNHAMDAIRYGVTLYL